MIDNLTVTPSCGNVFQDLGFSNAEAKIMYMRTKAMLDTIEHLKQLNLSQNELSAKLDITQSRISRFLQGKTSEFSLDMILTLATKAGLNPHISFDL